MLELLRGMLSNLLAHCSFLSRIGCQKPTHVIRSELARAHNETWREDLLARALATESASPGSVSPRALWLLGTLEASQFTAFAAILNLASRIDDALIIPSNGSFILRDVPDYENDA